MEHSNDNGHKIVTRALGGNEAALKKWTDEFIARYTEPQRHYHTFYHTHAIFQCLDQFRFLETTMKLAIFFHDWIYDPNLFGGLRHIL